ncbi:AAA family ATPase [Spiroplasma endosymbiont of Labia minor]|uniref:SF1B family DNA helicase RecD2 n=1 Tax=Spiroplasma endosymbiont of Labia minor TaxID=3066305 RepID=UPI0030CFABC2
MKIKGRISKFLYTNDSGWGVLLFKDAKSDSITYKVTGIVLNLKPKIIYELEGDFETDSKYGRSFKMTEYKIAEINSKQDIINFFSSSIFPSIGKSTAEIIFNNFGIDARKILKKDPAKIYEIEQISEEKAKIIFSVISENNENNFIEEKFMNQKLNIQILSNIRKIINDDTKILDILQNDFYLFAIKNKLRNFEEIDKIAIEFGTDQNGKERISAWANYFTNNYLIKTGDTYIKFEALIKKLSLKFNNIENLSGNLIYAKEKNILFFKNQKVYTNESYNDELIIARRLVELNTKSSMDENKINELITEIENEISIELKINNFAYSENQKEVLFKFISNDFSIVTGGPGTGKTTVINGITKLFRKYYHSSDIKLAAPTGRAKSKMNESTNIEAFTIHKLLGFKSLDQEPLYNSENKLNCDLLIIDEVSMIDNSLFSQLLSSLGKIKKFVLVGDVNQLPSVNYGDVLNNIIEAKRFETTILEKVFRQENGNGIADLAHLISIANKEATNFSDVFAMKNVEFIFENNVNNYEENIIKKYSSFFNGTIWNANVQIICPMYGGEIGIVVINNLIQKIFNSNTQKNKPKVFSNNKFNYYENDRIMFTKNEYDLGLSNGDVGYIKEMNIINDKKILNAKTIFNDKEIELKQSNFNDVDLSYACSVHKTQGSEFDYVILVLDPDFYPVFLTKKLIYTAVTRAKKELVIITDKKVFENSITEETVKRNTTLVNRLEEFIAKI